MAESDPDVQTILAWGALGGQPVVLHQLVPGALSLFFGSLFTKPSQPFQQLWNLVLLPGFSQPLDEVVHDRLILRIAFEGLSTLFDGLLISSRFQIDFRQDAPGRPERRLQ